MDDPALAAEPLRRALTGLARVNWLSRSTATLWGPIRALAREHAPRPLSLLDVATGSGDVPVAIGRRAAAAGVPLEIAACDINRGALALAQDRAARAGVQARLFAHDIVTDALPDRFDIVTCSLFMHHLRDAETVSVLRRLRDSARRLLLVSDLRRGVGGSTAAWIVPRLITASPVVHVDALRSARAAYSLAEFARLARQAGLANAEIAPRWPWRFLMRWRPEREERLP